MGTSLSDDDQHSNFMRVRNETLDPVFCVDEGAGPACHRVDGCPTHRLWARLGQAIQEVLDSVTLAELGEGPRMAEPVAREKV